MARGIGGALEASHMAEPCGRRMGNLGKNGEDKLNHPESSMVLECS